MNEILNRIENNRVFSVKISKDKKTLTIEESCDRCFEIKLNKHEMIQFLSEILSIISEMEFEQNFD